MIEPEEGDDHSSDEDFSPGHLIIDMADDHHNVINYTQQGYNNLPDQCGTCEIFIINFIAIVCFVSISYTP